MIDGALLVDSDGRGSWLRRACGGDEALRAVVERRLCDCKPGARAAHPTQADPREPEQAPTGSWHALTDDFRSRRIERPGGGAPRVVLAAGSGTLVGTLSESVVRARLRELPMIYILFLAMASSWRVFIMGDQDRVLHYLDAGVGVGLAGVIALLSGRRSLPMERL